MTQLERERRTLLYRVAAWYLGRGWRRPWWRRLKLARKTIAPRSAYSRRFLAEQDAADRELGLAHRRFVDHPSDRP